MERDQRDDQTRDDQRDDASSDNPGDATSPPGGGDRDEAAIQEGREKLDQAGGGH